MKECNVEELKEVCSTRQQYIEILQNIWYKLYMLQNYNITMDMFKGANLRWSTIVTYLSYIRAIYKGYNKNTSFKSLITYIQGLMDSGTEPFAKIDDSIITIQQLIDKKLLTPHEVEFIYSSVGINEEAPDVSSAWTKCCTNRNITDVHRDTYTTIVEELSENKIDFKQDITIRPSKKQDIFKPIVHNTNPITKNNNIKDIYKKAFKFI